MDQLELNFINSLKRYSEDDLKMFRMLIESKLERALSILEEHKEVMRGTGGNATNDTSWSFQTDDAPEYSNKQEAAILARKQEVFIDSLKSALFRIDNGTYGICIKTGDLIDRNRLIAVPNTTTGLLVKIQMKDQIIPDNLENLE